MLKIIKKGSLGANLTSNLIQTLFSTFISFFLFRYIIINLGAANFGIWSVILATVSTSRIFEFGLGAAVTRFVALDIANDDLSSASKTIQTATLSLLVFLSFIIPVLYFPLNYSLPFIFEGLGLEDARTLLPFALISLWINIIASVFQASLEGFQRMDVRAGLLVTGHLLMLIFTIFLVPKHGLIGLAYAQVIQAIYVLIVGWILLRKITNILPYFPFYFSWTKLKTLLPYGVNVQGAGLFMMFFDPLTKAFMTRFGGLEAAGYFEIANQVAIKVRAIIITTNQAVVPKVTEMIEKTNDRLNIFYNNNVKIIFFVAVPLFVLLEIWSGHIITILFGSYNTLILYIYHITLFSWFFNLFAGPAYFSNLGSGHVFPNTISHFSIGSINLILGLLLGSNFGLNGVLWAYSISLIIGSIYLILNFHLRNGLKFNLGSIFKNKFFVIINLIILIVSHYLLSINKINNVKNLIELNHFSILLLTLITVITFYYFAKKPLNKIISN